MALPRPLPPLPAVLPPEVARFYANGMPAPDQVRFETVLHIWLAALPQQFVPINASSLPTVDPHVVGQVWNSAGTLKVSAG